MRNLLHLSCALSLFLVLCGCDQRSSNTPPPQKQSNPAGSASEFATIDAATAGSISGVIRFVGQAPAPQRMDVSLDPACSLENDPKYAALAQPIQVQEGKLANVYVYVKRGLPDVRYKAPAEKVVVDQKGCQYQPRVVGLMAGQTIEFQNNSIAEHNIHPTPTDPANHEFNDVQQPRSAPIDRTFNAPEVMMPVRCSQHPWMKLLVNVSNHPFFAVTGADGKFELKGVPPGTYLIAAVHEKLGIQTATVTIAAKENKAGVELTFKP